MTANELADKLGMVRIGLTLEAATMLRQQAQEITELRKIVEGTIGQAFYEDDYHKAQIEIEALKKELALQRLSDIGQEIEQTELQTLVKSFFEDYLNYQEESDSGRVFNPIHVSCTRAMMIEPLAKLLMRMKELSGVKE